MSSHHEARIVCHVCRSLTAVSRQPVTALHSGLVLPSKKTVLQTAERMCGERELNLIYFNIMSGRKEGEKSGIKPLHCKDILWGLNYMKRNNNEPYSISQNQPLSVFFLWSSYCGVGSALAPREKFHVWIYKLHFFTTLIHPDIAPPAYEPGFSSLISELCQLC